MGTTGIFCGPKLLSLCGSFLFFENNLITVTYDTDPHILTITEIDIPKWGAMSLGVYNCKHKQTEMQSVHNF